MTEIKTIDKPNSQYVLERTFLFLVLVFLFSHAAHAGNIVKWVDSNGVVHYGDSLPTKAAGKGNSVLNKDGVIVKRNQKYQVRNADLEAKNAEQMRKDIALLASYSSVEEIDLALKRNLSTEKNVLRVLMVRLLDTKNSLSKKIAIREKTRSKQQVVASYLKQDIEVNQSKVERTQADITATNNNIALMKNRFARYKTRYVELRPRNQSLSAINHNNRNLTELIIWKREANTKLSQYLTLSVQHRRAGESVPDHIVKGIQKVNQEIARADQEIAMIRTSIKDSQQTFTSK